MVIMKYLGSIIFLLLLTAALYADGDQQQYSAILHCEIASYNRVYDSMEYRENAATTFPVFMINEGAEYHYRDAEGYTLGGGFGSAAISSGEVYNFDHFEKQPFTTIILPYFFVGNDFGTWALEMGISYYLMFQSLPARDYYLENGSEVEREEGGIALKRRDSHVFFNVLIRFLSEEGLHFKIRLGRERFHVIDSLFNAAVVYPFNDHIVEFYVSFPTKIPGYMPQSNQRFGLVYSYSFTPFILGLSLGYLAYNFKGGGDGNMNIFDVNNFSLGFHAGLRW